MTVQLGPQSGVHNEILAAGTGTTERFKLVSNPKMSINLHLQLAILALLGSCEGDAGLRPDQTWTVTEDV